LYGGCTFLYFLNWCGGFLDDSSLLHSIPQMHIPSFYAYTVICYLVIHMLNRLLYHHLHLFLSPAMAAPRLPTSFRVNSPNVKYTDEHITSEYQYKTTKTKFENGELVVEPVDISYTFKTERKVPRLGYVLPFLFSPFSPSSYFAHITYTFKT
jgi:hypothetical protein